MEETGKDVQLPASSGKSKLRYKLRSAIKSKDDKPSPKAGKVSMTSATKRVRPSYGVSKSMNVLDLTNKEKAAKPPRRLSVPAKTGVTPAAKRIDSMAPISEERFKRPARIVTKSDTPSSEASKSGMKRVHSRLATASYWISQIKLAEIAAKHSISLGFFKLALEAGCEPKQLMRNELKAYIRKYNLEEYGALVNELFGSYGITEKLEDLKAAENTSEVIQGSTKSFGDDAQSATSSIRSRNLHPKSLNTNVAGASTARSINKENVQKKSLVKRTTRESVARTSATMKRTPRNTAQKNTEDAKKEKSGQLKVNINKKEAKTVNIEDNLESVTQPEDEDKENMGSQMQAEELATATLEVI